jgi:putative SOS response-associated peptidase YedK
MAKVLEGGQVVPLEEVVLAQAFAREYRPFRWGFDPSWAKDPAIGNCMINARSETAATKPTVRKPLS